MFAMHRLRLSDLFHFSTNSAFFKTYCVQGCSTYFQESATSKSSRPLLWVLVWSRAHQRTVNLPAFRPKLSSHYVDLHTSHTSAVMLSGASWFLLHELAFIIAQQSSLALVQLLLLGLHCPQNRFASLWKLIIKILSIKHLKRSSALFLDSSSAALENTEQHFLPLLVKLATATGCYLWVNALRIFPPIPEVTGVGLLGFLLSSSSPSP